MPNTAKSSSEQIAANSVSYSPPFLPRRYEERSVDIGELTLNYVAAGNPASPALLLIPGQASSWWTYEDTIPHLESAFQVFAIDLRGQGRTTWTPHRYTLDNIGNDLVRFIEMAIGRPVIVSGSSSGGVMAAWLSAFAKPGQVRAAVLEDPALFLSELSPIRGNGIREAFGARFYMYYLYSTYLGRQWSIGDWDGLRQAAAQSTIPSISANRLPESPPQNLREYDPEWATAFWEGTFYSSCPHEAMLTKVKTPILYTAHGGGRKGTVAFERNGLGDVQVTRVREIVGATDVPLEFRWLPDAVHAMHADDPATFSQILVDWMKRLPN